MKTTTECKCGSEFCSRRIVRGLAPFCSDEISVSDGRKRDEENGIFTCYSLAVAASPVGKARWISGGGTAGSPARFKALAS